MCVKRERRSFGAAREKGRAWSVVDLFRVMEERTGGAGGAADACTLPGSAAASASASASAAAAVAAPRAPPRSLLLFHAVVKKSNIGAMLRSAAAFGVSEAIVSGAAGVHVFGAKGAERHVPLREFARFADAAAWLKAQGVALCGIEIDARAKDVATRPFSGDTCFLPGNEGAGLTDAQKAACDEIVYVRQCGNGTASLNVAAATAIVLHHFAEWAQMPERPREAGRDKFLVEKAPAEAPRAGVAADVAAHKREARRRLREADDGALSGLALGAALRGGDEEEEEGEEEEERGAACGAALR